MNIRRATLADIPAIMSIVKEAVPLMQAAGNFQWNDSYPNPEAFEGDVALNQLWVADIDGRVAGASAITTEQYPEYEQAGLDISQPAIVTHRLVVSPYYRGLGIAESLLMQAEYEADRRGIPLLRIDTNKENKAAQKLFVKLGYIFAGEIGLAFRPGMRFVCLEKKLT
ncbi:GNAT family N-acetyltransferase [Mucilaginibacter psychrotolerans]|uniref:GNAT family N-acetyltransferase n=1 Tax=Mucilaginibacter psychrotolerans TaxID=1524096 RepID=A0A4Y8S4Q3_9SPHI|nr:GNAT family N-acetyltransferase [Mucilaginibacter psychrotolerans]TFF33414.1 GNAT family N-acetyltransferase [Mucilaginibacter psychrotolerans]